MKTLIITIDEPVAAAPNEYPIAVHFDDGAADWKTVAKASGVLGAGLATAPYPVDTAGQPLTPAAIVDFLQNQNTPSATFKTIGDHLWSLFAQSNAGPFLTATLKAHSRVNAGDPREGVRTILDVRPPGLQRLPWELMTAGNVPLFAAPLNPVVRGPLVPNPAPQASGLLLKVLVLVGSKPNDAAVQAEEEIEALEDGVRPFRREIDLRVERPQSIEKLTRLLTDFTPHVLHFTGHGGEVEQVRQPTLSSLVFQDGAGGTWDWTSAEIPGTLAAGAPRLAFLNACRSAAASPRSIVGALSTEFLAAGTCGVVAMQADIAGAAAAEFSGAAYGALAQGKSLDAALAQARFTVRQRTGMADRRDWCLPSLTVSVDVDQVLPPRLDLTREQRDRLEATPEFVAIQAFVDRREQRRSVDPLADPDVVESLLIVTGPPETGKTSMLLWFLEGCAWCDHAVKYVDLERPGKPGFLDVLQWIERAETNPASSLREALPGDFTRVHQVADVVRVAKPGKAGTPDDPVDSLFTAFRAALVAAAQKSPLIIALDHLGSMDPDAFRDFLRPYLLDHVAQRRMRPVRFVLGCTGDEFGELGLGKLAPARKIDVSNFAASEFTALYREYLLCRNVPRAKIPMPPPVTRDRDFPPKDLEKLYEVLVYFNKLGN